MKKIVFILLIFVFKIQAQDYFSTTSNSNTSNKHITHYGTLVIGDLNTGAVSPWTGDRFELLVLDNKSKGSSLFIQNNYGHLSANVAHATGAYHPSAKAGDVVFKIGRQAKRMIFSLNNSNDNSIYGDRSIIFGDNTNKKTLTVLSNGKVGVGTLRPDSKFTVKGKIHCEEVKVDLQVPADYVFEKYYTGKSTLKTDYKMPTLEEVEAFTKKNNHLPEMPSAKEIKEEGLYLKKMTNLLLQKIEELTLYTIEQEKRIKKLEKQLGKK